MKKKIILSAGGTGGHLFPAQSLAAALPDWEILFVAGGLKSSRYFDRSTFTCEEIECATFSFSKPLHVLKGCGKIVQGVRHSQKIIRNFSPDLIVGFGSFFTLPVLVAALLEKVPFVLHEQNAIPGKVNTLFSLFAHTTTLTFPQSRSYLKKRAQERAVEVIFPLRTTALRTREENYAYFGLNASVTTLLVFGGSQGAARLNTLFLEAAAYLPPVQVIHFTGNEERAEVAKKRYLELGIKASVKPFEHHMDRAMHIADFAITRAGASTIAELIEYELPALLIPYPFATQNHQENNALHFTLDVKGGKMYKELELEPASLARILSQELQSLPEKKKNIAMYKQQRLAKPLAQLIKDIVHDKK